jgi:hypothetical protein
MGLARYSPLDKENQALACPLNYQIGLLVCLDHRRATVHAFWGPDSIRCTPPFVADISPPCQSPIKLPQFAPSKAIHPPLPALPPVKTLRVSATLLACAALTIWALAQVADDRPDPNENLILTIDSINELSQRMSLIEQELKKVSQPNNAASQESPVDAAASKSTSQDRVDVSEVPKTEVVKPSASSTIKKAT